MTFIPFLPILNFCTYILLLLPPDCCSSPNLSKGDVLSLWVFLLVEWAGCFRWEGWVPYHKSFLALLSSFSHAVLILSLNILFPWAHTKSAEDPRIGSIYVSSSNKKDNFKYKTVQILSSFLHV